MTSASLAQRLRSQSRLLFGSLGIAGLIMLALAIITVYFPFVGLDRRMALVRWWAQRMLGVCHVRLEVRGEKQGPDGGVMVVLNHISWIDIYVLDAFRATRFVAKSEIRHWPVIGFLCDRTGTIFIERARRRAVREANHAVVRVLQAGGRIGVFPEGTTSDGSGLLPFHANLIQAAIDAQAWVQPAALRYLHADGRISTAAAYVGEATLIDSVRDLLLGGPTIAQLTLLEPIAARHQTRHQIAQQAREAISASLGFGTRDSQPDDVGASEDPLL